MTSVMGAVRQKVKKADFGARRYQGTLLLLLFGITAWGQIVSHPALLVDLSGMWEVCPLPGAIDETTGCRWRQASMPSHFVANSDDIFDNLIKYRKEFESPEICLTHTCKLIVGEVGDSASVEINGALVRQATPLNQKPIYEKNFPLGVDLPPALLHPKGRANHLLVTVYSFRDQQVGLRAGPIGITTNSVGTSFLQWRSFRNVFLPLACSIVCAVIVFLVGFLRRSGVAASLWETFFRYATASAIFLFSFSEIPRQFAPMVYVVPGHFLLRFYTDYALFDLLRTFFQGQESVAWRATKVYYRLCFVGFTGLLLAGLATELSGVHLLEASATFSFVLVAYPITTLGPVCMVAGAIRNKQWMLAGCFLVTLCAVLHEWAIGSGFYAGEFVSKYSSLVVTVMFLIALVKKSAHAQASEVAALVAEKDLAQLARQVDHDIRSPLTALDIAVRQLDSVPENVRVLIRMAVSRIRDIANSLRQRQNGATQSTSSDLDDKREHLLLTSIVDAVVSEKRMQFSEHVQLEFDQPLSFGSYDLFIWGEAGQLKRAISNLLNNAAEAMAMRGRVSIATHGDSAAARIVITDHGPGMPQEIIARLGQKGVTSGKAGGSGLGIHHAMHTLQKWGGSLVFAAPIGGGTEVTMQLPRCEAPTWFAKRITLEARQTVVILDDDRAVHAAWRERLHMLDVVLVHVSSQSQLELWVQRMGRQQVTFFIDFELTGSQNNGLDIIVQLGLKETAFLVTSHFETQDVLERCRAQGIRMVPKSLVDIVPLEGSAVASAA